MPTPRKSREPIPAAGVIRLSVAFTQFYRAMVPRWEELDAAAEKDLASNRGAKPGQSNGRVMRLRDKIVKRAELKFREHLAAGMLIPHMRDPDTGERVTMANPNDWAARHNFGVPGIWEDYVWTGDLVQPGPDAMIRGELQPVFFEQSDFDSFMGRIEAVTGNIKEVHPRTAKNDPTSVAGRAEASLGAMQSSREPQAEFVGSIETVTGEIKEVPRTAKTDPTSVAAEAEARLAAMQSSRDPDADFHMLPSNQPTQRAQTLAWQALKFLFQDGKVPKKLSIYNLTERVNGWLSKQSGKIADRPKVGESTVARVLGRKK